MDKSLIASLILIGFGMGSLAMALILRLIRKQYENLISAKNEHIKILEQILSKCIKDKKGQINYDLPDGYEGKLKTGDLEYVGSCECYKPHPVSHDNMSRCGSCGGNIIYKSK